MDEPQIHPAPSGPTSDPQNWLGRAPFLAAGLLLGLAIEIVMYLILRGMLVRAAAHAISVGVCMMVMFYVGLEFPRARPRFFVFLVFLGIASAVGTWITRGGPR